MDLSTVILCFKKFITYLEVNEKMVIPAIDFTEITIFEIDKIVQTLFMDYTIKCDKMSVMAKPCVLYKHLNVLIRQYIQENNKPMIKVIPDFITN